MTNYRQKFREAKESIRKSAGSGDITDDDADRLLDWLAAYDTEDMTTPVPTDGEYATDTKEKEASTLKSWAVVCHRTAKRLRDPYGLSLSDADADGINQLMSDLRSGRHPDVKDSGLANNTIRNAQGYVRKFYRYHDDLGVDDDVITLIQGDDTHIDERDMLTGDEIDAMRNAADDPRDLAIFDLLLYTGQRSTAIRSLRIKDIDLDDGVYYLNTDAEGLKGADKNGYKRPLLGAVGAVREWLRYHPDSDNPDAYLITTKPRYSQVDPESMVSGNTIRRATEKLGQKAGVDKPTNPHTIRHNFVTIAKRDYGMDNGTVKHLIGHSPDSNVMETTYRHLTDEDFIEDAEVAAGIREAEDGESLSPDICHCGEPLSDGAKACPRCGTVYAPDANAAKEQMDEQVKESYKQTHPDDGETIEELGAIEEALDDPETMNKLLDNDEAMDKIADKVADRLADD